MKTLIFLTFLLTTAFESLQLDYETIELLHRGENDVLQVEQLIRELDEKLSRLTASAKKSIADFKHMSTRIKAQGSPNEATVYMKFILKGDVESLDSEVEKISQQLKTIELTRNDNSTEFEKIVLKGRRLFMELNTLSRFQMRRRDSVINEMKLVEESCARLIKARDSKNTTALFAEEKTLRDLLKQLYTKVKHEDASQVSQFPVDHLDHANHPELLSLASTLDKAAQHVTSEMKAQVDQSRTLSLAFGEKVKQWQCENDSSIKEKLEIEIASKVKQMQQLASEMQSKMIE